MKDVLSWLFGGVGVTFLTVGFFVARRFFSKIISSASGVKKYAGCYDCFHLSTSDPTVVIRSFAKFYFNHWGRAEVEFTSFKYRYRGSVKAVDSNVYLSMAGEGHKENVLFVLNEPLTSEFDVLAGVFSAVTEDRVPVAGKMFMHKVGQAAACEKIELQVIDRRIRDFLVADGNPMRVPPLQIPLFEDL